MTPTTASHPRLASVQASRYDRVAVLLHWLIGLGMIAQLAFGFLLDTVAPSGTPDRAATINLHKSIGMLLGILVLARIAWRLGHHPPPWPRALSGSAVRAARLGHRVLYLLMLVLPLSGYLMSNFGRYGVNFFGIHLPPWGPDDRFWRGILGAVHEYGGWLFAAVIAGHVLAVFFHDGIRKDGMLKRMSWSGRNPG